MKGSFYRSFDVADVEQVVGIFKRAAHGCFGHSISLFKYLSSEGLLGAEET